mgnify:CR=1 FL=1
MSKLSKIPLAETFDKSNAFTKLDNSNKELTYTQPTNPANPFAINNYQTTAAPQVQQAPQAPTNKKSKQIINDLPPENIELQDLSNVLSPDDLSVQDITENPLV